MPIVTVLQGPRDVTLKRELVKNITEAVVESYDVGPETVQVWIHEVKPDSWGAGGKLVGD
jgi:4-oxalocrotonate tautomerase